MKTVFFFVSLFLVFSSLHSIDVTIRDDDHLFFLNTTLSFNFTIQKEDSNNEISAVITNGTAGVPRREQRGSNFFHTFDISLQGPSPVKALSLTIEAENSTDNMKRYVRQFYLNATFNADTPQLNTTSGTLIFVVRPPSFSHFQVKSDWLYWCPVDLSLALCHVENGTTVCSSDRPYNLISATMKLKNTRFHGGMALGHDYSSRVEECPLAYETKKDIGIACIVTFWTIALAIILWGVIKFLIKRHRKRAD